jgi:hypothetical protein
MLTISAKDVTLSLEVRGYQYPDTTMDGWDSEWLQIAGSAGCAKGRWQFSDPCLTTFELMKLAAWIRDVPAGGPERELEFTEPCLRFEHIERADGDVLVVRLAQEASPPWATEAERFREGVTLEFPFATVDFNNLASTVAEMCAKFPQRAGANAG